jgi:hypothetical protein
MCNIKPGIETFSLKNIIGLNKNYAFLLLTKEIYVFQTWIYNI